MISELFIYFTMHPASYFPCLVFQTRYGPNCFAEQSRKGSAGTSSSRGGAVQLCSACRRSNPAANRPDTTHVPYLSPKRELSPHAPTVNPRLLNLIGRISEAEVSQEETRDWHRRTLTDFLRGSSASHGAGAPRLQTRSVLLPAIAAVAAISAAPASAAVASTPAATAPAPTAVSSAPASTSTALRLGTCFIHHEVSAAKILPVQGIDGAVRVFVIGDFHESETTRLARETIANQIDARRCNSHLGKPLLKLLFRRGKRKITDIELLHLLLLLPGTHMRVAERAEGDAIVHSEAKKRGRRGERDRYFSGLLDGLGN